MDATDVIQEFSGFGGISMTEEPKSIRETLPNHLFLYEGKGEVPIFPQAPSAQSVLQSPVETYPQFQWDQETESTSKSVTHEAYVPPQPLTEAQIIDELTNILRTLYARTNPMTEGRQFLDRFIQKMSCLNESKNPQGKVRSKQAALPLPSQQVPLQEAWIPMPRSVVPLMRASPEFIVQGLLERGWR